MANSGCGSEGVASDEFRSEGCIIGVYGFGDDGPGEALAFMLRVDGAEEDERVTSGGVSTTS